MRILFYLPAITEAWLDRIVLPLIRIAASDAEVHVIVPPLWNGSGIGGESFRRLSGDSGATWHLFDDPDHHLLRTSGSALPRLMRLVSGIAPDHTICRSADVATPQAFPGRTSFLMEADYPPFARGGLVRLTGAEIFAHGVTPALTDAQQSRLGQAMLPIRDALSASHRAQAGARAAFFAETGLAEASLAGAGHAGDRLVVGMPLEHDGPDNPYMLHSPAPLNPAFVRQVAAGLDDRCLLALTLHPAQRRDPVAMERLAALGDERIRILQAEEGRDLTPSLARHCDAMVFRDSKSIAWAAMFEKPIFRLSRFASGGWLNAYPTLSGFDHALRAGSARRPRVDDFLLWLGFHLANDAFDPADPGLDLAELIDRILRPLDPERWTLSLERSKADVESASAAIASIGA